MPTREYYDEVPDDPFSRCLDDYNMTLDVIADRFSREAVRRGWCAEFEDFVDSVNEIIPHPLVVHKAQQAELTVTLKYNVTVHGARTGATDDQLEERFLSQLDGHIDWHYFRENLAFEMGPNTAAVVNGFDVKVVRRT